MRELRVMVYISLNNSAKVGSQEIMGSQLFSYHS